MKKLGMVMLAVVMLAGVFAGCGKKEEAVKDVPVEEIAQAIRDAYGDTYLPNAPLDEEMLGSMYSIDMELIEEFVAEMPMIGFHPDRVIIAKAVEGKGEELEEQFLAVREFLVEDSMMYPANIAKTEASSVERVGDYVAFLLVGAPNDNMDASEEEQLKFAEEQAKIAVDAFYGCFE